MKQEIGKEFNKNVWNFNQERNVINLNNSNINNDFSEFVKILDENDKNKNINNNIFDKNITFFSKNNDTTKIAVIILVVAKKVQIWNLTRRLILQ